MYGGKKEIVKQFQERRWEQASHVNTMRRSERISMSKRLLSQALRGLQKSGESTDDRIIPFVADVIGARNSNKLNSVSSDERLVASNSRG